MSAIPANIVRKGKGPALQFIHYPTIVPAASDFDQAADPTSKGNCLNGAANPGDQTTFDYVDLRSLNKGGAKTLSILARATGGVAELWIVLNPIVRMTNRGYVPLGDRTLTSNDVNVGFDASERVHRIVVPASGLIATYVLEDVSIEGFNIDYNGAASGAGTPNLDLMVITAY